MGFGRRIGVFGRRLELMRCHSAPFSRLWRVKTTKGAYCGPQSFRRSSSKDNSKTVPTCPPIRAEEYHNEDFFRFTRGRFVANEQYEMSQRHVRFDAYELGRLAAKAVGSKTCVAIEKYPDGMYNKALLLTMDDGMQAVAKVPNPNAGQPYYTTSSEVATMEFARTVHKTPVPKVFAWSSTVEGNSVGAEYIIMEKVPGIQLETAWPKMKIEDQLSLIKTIARYQKAWTSCSFNRFGSLYFAKDLVQDAKRPLYTDSNGVQVENSKFAVGPSTGRRFNDDGRSTVELDRGPWNTLEEYVTAVGKREMACIQQLDSLPKSPVTLHGPGTYQPTREKKLKALQHYLTILKYLLPVDESIQSSCLWHGDLHLENIIVDPKDFTKVVGIIDWQSTELAPLYEHASKPSFLKYEGPPVIGLERARLPANIAELDPAIQRKARALWMKQNLTALYMLIIHTIIPRLYRAMEFQNTPSFDLLLYPRCILVDGEAVYLGLVADLEGMWADLPGVRARGAPSFPIKFTKEELREIEADAHGAVRGMDAMGEVQEALGELFPDMGCIRTDRYEASRDALRQVEEQVIDRFASTESDRKAWQESWPFDS